MIRIGETVVYVPDERDGARYIVLAFDADIVWMRQVHAELLHYMTAHVTEIMPARVNAPPVKKPAKKPAKK